MLSLCGVVMSLQQTLILPLLPELPALLDTTADNASWLVTATLLSGAIVTVTLSRLADMYGKRRMVLVALGVTVLGSLLGALGQDLPLLIAARALQGVGVSLVPIGIAMMRDELPRERLPLGIAIMSATLAVGAGAGLPLGGAIATHLDWHAIFWVTGVVGVVLLVAASWVLNESPVRTGGVFDLRGAGVLTAALTALLVALSKGAHWGWSSPLTCGLTLLGAALLALWIPLELRTPAPLVDLRIAARPVLLLVNGAAVLTGFAMYANMLVTTLQLQLPVATGAGLGLSMAGAGAWLAPNAIAFGLMAPVSAGVTGRVGPGSTLLIGSTAMFVAYVGRAFVSDTLVQIVVGSMAVGIGTGLVYGALPTLITRAVPVTETASANGLNVLLRSFGTSTASATTAAVASTATAQVASVGYPSHAALVVVFWLAAAAALGAAIAAVPLTRLS
jgi:MFS family permease